MKTLADFKQQVAEKYGDDSFSGMDCTLESLLWRIDEAAELYAEYRAKEAVREFEKKIGIQLEALFIYRQGWNEALHWAADNAKVHLAKCENPVICDSCDYPLVQCQYPSPKVNKESILKGLKK